MPKAKTKKPKAKSDVKPKKKAKPLNKRQRSLVAAVKETGGNVAKAGKIADPPYATRKTAWQAWQTISSRPDIAAEMESHQDLNRQSLLNDLAELVKATKAIGYLQQYIKTKDGGVEKIGPDEAVSNDFLEWPDWSARAKGLQMAFKLRQEMVDRLKIEQEVDEEGAIVKIAAVLKGRGKTWAAVRKHLKTLGAEIPDGTPDWWEEL